MKSVKGVIRGSSTHYDESVERRIKAAYDEDAVDYVIRKVRWVVNHIWTRVRVPLYYSMWDYDEFD